MRAIRTMSLTIAAALLAMVTVSAKDDAVSQALSLRIVGGPFVISGGTMYWLDPVNAPPGWKALPNASFTLPPIDVATIAYYDGQRVITDSGEGWGKVGGVWTDLGSIPGTPVAKTSWGELKVRYAH